MIRLVGDITDASTHFAQVGLASILEDAGVEKVRFFWEDGPSARAVVMWDGDADVGQIVKDHATRCCQEDSWVSQSVPVQGAKKVTGLGLFSPRITPRKTQEESADWAERRRIALDTLPLTRVDRSMIGALGEPAYWHRTLVSGDKDLEPDRGASRWDMMARNRGDNFVPHGLRKYAAVVADRTPQAIVDGLTGDALVDESDKGKHMTPLGFRNRSPMDTATAWCMLWGISATTLVPRPASDTASKGMSQTSGADNRSKVHPTRLTLPVFRTPTSISRWSGVLRSRAWDSVVGMDNMSALSPVVLAQLNGMGVFHAIQFETEVAVSASTPERCLKGGVVVGISHDW